MAVIVLVLGKSGTGKSFSFRNMPRDTTSIINVAGKPFPFRDTSGLIKKTKIDTSCGRIEQALRASVAKSIIVDDAQFLMAFEFMERALDKGFDKFTEIGRNFFNLVRVAAQLAPDKIVYFMSHTDTDDRSGQECMNTIGKMLQDKICIEGLFTIVLKTVVLEAEPDPTKKFCFATINNGLDTVKTPYGMFADPLIPNDLQFADDSIRAYYGIEIKQLGETGNKEKQNGKKPSLI
jgi:hypothetical protein